MAKRGSRPRQKSGSGNGGKSPLFKLIITSVGGVLVSLGIVSGLSFSAWQAELNTRKAVLQEFQDNTKDYILWGNKARIDVYEKGYDHLNKSKDMNEWEGIYYKNFTKVLERVGQECPDETNSVLKGLRCANTRFYSCYDAMKHKESFLKTVKDDRLKLRLEEDCGTAEWSALTIIGDRNEPEILNQQAKEQYRELEAAQASAVRAIRAWSEMSHIKYIVWRVKQYFVL
jgi:hypothetical protein